MDFVGLASSIITILETSIELLCEARDIYKSDSIRYADEMLEVLRSAQMENNELAHQITQVPTTNLADDERAIQKHIELLQQPSNELARKLDSLTVTASRDRERSSVGKVISSSSLALKAWWKQSEIEALVARLERLHQSLSNIVRKRDNRLRLKKEKADDILDSLSFPSDNAREHQIRTADDETLDWMFDGSRTKFRRWLEEGNSIFWISGKAGSGKSTMMKFISNDPRTVEALQSWIEDRDLVVASHYFWKSAHTMQRSQRGLLQTLLRKILEKHPDVMPRLLPVRWCTARALERTRPWTEDELMDTLGRLSDVTTSSTKFCFFVDGLDEYEGSRDRLIKCLETLSRHDHFKICVSTRPDEIAFALDHKRSDEHLILHDHTWNDVRQYVHNNVIETSRFHAIAPQDQSSRKRHEGFEERIADVAEGVWLWVYLVVERLICDLENGEDFEQLQRTLDTFPKDLRTYYSRIVQDIGEQYRKEADMLIQMHLHDKFSTLRLTAVYFVYICCHDGCDPSALRPLKEDRATIARSRQLLSTRCKGLLDSMENDLTVSHRSVTDFLGEHYPEELVKARGAGLNVDAALCNYHLAVLQGYGETEHRHNRARACGRYVRGFINTILALQRGGGSEVVSELAESFHNLMMSEDWPTTPQQAYLLTQARFTGPNTCFQHFVLGRNDSDGIFAWCSERWKINLQSAFWFPLLCIDKSLPDVRDLKFLARRSAEALHQEAKDALLDAFLHKLDWMQSSDLHTTDRKLVYSMIQMGANPNVAAHTASKEDSTPWLAFLHILNHYLARINISRPGQAIESGRLVTLQKVLMMLIEGGADLTSSMTNTSFVFHLPATPFSDADDNQPAGVGLWRYKSELEKPEPPDYMTRRMSDASSVSEDSSPGTPTFGSEPLSTMNLADMGHVSRPDILAVRRLLGVGAMLKNGYPIVDYLSFWLTEEQYAIAKVKYAEQIRRLDLSAPAQGVESAKAGSSSKSGRLSNLNSMALEGCSHLGKLLVGEWKDAYILGVVGTVVLPTVIALACYIMLIKSP